GHEPQRLAAHAGGDGVLLLRLVQGADGPRDAIEEGDLRREGIAEKPRDSKGYVDPGATEPGQRDDLVAGEAEGTGVPGRAGADQRQRLGDVVTAGAHVGGAPDGN